VIFGAHHLIENFLIKLSASSSNSESTTFSINLITIRGGGGREGKKLRKIFLLGQKQSRNYANVTNERRILLLANNF
jgi:hypothetical protein